MKNFFKAFLAFAAVMFFLNIPNTVYADTKIEVYLNGQLVTFKEAQPINYNNRVMVPTREIIEYLGFKVNYDEATATMICTKDSLTVTHKLLTNIITVNGVSQTFDTPSIINNNKNLMPVAMIAQTLGATFTYEPIEPVIKVGIIINADAEVKILSFSKASVDYGGSIVISAITNSQTTRVRLTEANGNLISDLTNYTTLQDGTRFFNYTWTPATKPQTATIAMITATPGNVTSYNDAGKKISTIPLLGPPVATITDVTTKSGNITVGDTITVTVTTNKFAEKVKITNDFNNTAAESTNYTISGDKRIFSVNMKIEKEGERTLTVDVANTSGYDTKESKTYLIDVISNKTVSSLAIIDVTVSPSSVKPGSNATVTVVTSSYATKVRIEDSSYYSVKSLSSPTKTDTYNGTKTWEFSIRMTETGSFNYYAVASQSSKEVEKRFTIKCSSSGSSSSSSSDLTIKDIYYDNYSSSYADITVVTSTDIEYVELFDSNWNLVDDLISYKSSSSSKNERVWVFYDVKISGSGSKKFNIRAYDYYDYYVQDSITISGSSSSSSSGYATIYSVYTDKDDYSGSDRVYVEVETNTDVVEVEILDRYGDRITRKTSYTSKSGSRLIWEINFRPDNYYSGKTTYTVVAYDNYNDKDEEDFYIWVY